ncbi:hypothetical protein Bpfe_030047 [Biomphalaria pfeifferi]|uniref:Uncharacterized protein n=1 Tax=Biomphalaria pfeifferi TaxID=112525 RepID=A0AAD8AQJ3_BIOPF|nr:hypothetical protein Bpfe_030047 [Biomphalaria pfeifferi]
MMKRAGVRITTSFNCPTLKRPVTIALQNNEEGKEIYGERPDGRKTNVLHFSTEAELYGNLRWGTKNVRRKSLKSFPSFTSNGLNLWGAIQKGNGKWKIRAPSYYSEGEAVRPV